ncbi:MAG: Unknown protein [uncultured Thiotrichaceae bacterium]|uniref:Uncharacterized protein n=1 Tax=uncultured Thiotrichaceae bacterium TaxID=298394 RepID=A0A6S6U0V8_9GAMM|nr:MAG: Unknown protein [uncultured Thiotrichaceae bacterium]
MDHFHHPAVACKMCGSLHTRRIHRTFFEIHLFRVKAIVHCGECHKDYIYK